MAKSHAAAERLEGLVRRLRNDIKFGSFSHGEWLKLIDLQQRYGATQFDIRKCLAELKTQRLVEHRVNHGFRVATPDPGQREQLYFVRTAIERSAAGLVVERATDEDIAALSALAAAFDRSVEEEGRQHQAATNAAFHDRFFAIAGNPVLAETVQSLRERSHFGTSGRWRTTPGLRASGAEHHAMIDAIQARDAATLDRLIVHHIAAF